jgi:hypothetical protein
VSRHDAERLNDIIAAVAAIADHTTRGGLDDGLVFDAVPRPPRLLAHRVVTLGSHEPSIAVHLPRAGSGQPRRHSGWWWGQRRRLRNGFIA